MSEEDKKQVGADAEDLEEEPKKDDNLQKRYGNIAKNPLNKRQNKNQKRFDSADWAMNKEGGGGGGKPPHPTRAGPPATSKLAN